MLYKYLTGEKMTGHRPSYLWDYEISEQEFKEILAGERVIGRLDQDWAALRLL